MPPKGKINKAPVISGLEGTDITLSKAHFRIGPRIGAGGFGLIYLGQILSCAPSQHYYRHRHHNHMRRLNISRIIDQAHLEIINHDEGF